MKLKILLFFLVCWFNCQYLLCYKITIQNKLRLNSRDKYTLITSGDRIDGRYRVIEKTNELICPAMNEEWIASDEVNENRLVILKFYLKKLSENTVSSKTDENYEEESFEVVETPLTLWRRSDDFFTDSTEECKQLKIITYRIPQTITNVKFDECLTENVERPIGNERAILDSNNQTAITIEKALSDYISTPYYNVLTKPKGVNLFELCIIGSCKELLQQISKNLMIGMKILSSDRECYVHGNLKVYSLFWEYSKEILTISNMKYNKYPVSYTKNSAPWDNDMLDIALLLAKILKRDINFEIKKLRLTSALDLFLKINPWKQFPKVARKIKPSASSQANSNYPYNVNTTSRIVAYFNEKYRFETLRSDETEFNVSLHNDIELGVPPNFNPNDENFSFDDLNKQLENSIYDFIIRLVGKSYVKNIKYDQFPSPNEALEHPFLVQKMDVRILPSDV